MHGIPHTLLSILRMTDDELEIYIMCEEPMMTLRGRDRLMILSCYFNTFPCYYFQLFSLLYTYLPC
jgi:hypothetical protein